LKEKESRFSALAKLEEADKSLPDCLRSRIKLNRKNFENGD
jgi:hypothetical protein